MLLVSTYAWCSKLRSFWVLSGMSLNIKEIQLRTIKILYVTEINFLNILLHTLGNTFYIFRVMYGIKGSFWRYPGPMCVCTLTIVLQFHMHNMQGVSTHNHIAISFWISRVFMQHYMPQNMNSSTFPELQNVKPFHYISQVPYLWYSRVFLKMFPKLSQCMNYITVSDLVKTPRNTWDCCQYKQWVSIPLSVSLVQILLRNWETVINWW